MSENSSYLEVSNVSLRLHVKRVTIMICFCRVYQNFELVFLMCRVQRARRETCSSIRRDRASAHVSLPAGFALFSVLQKFRCS